MMAEPEIDELAQYVSSSVRKRGEQYFRGGRVRLQSGDNGSCAAEVYGSEVYEVDCYVDKEQPDTLVADCTCPFVADKVAICKHIWATILAASSKGWLTGLGVPLRGLLLDEPIDDIYANEDDFPHGEFGPAHKKAPLPPRQPTTPDWQRHLGELRPPATAPPRTGNVWGSNRQLLYALAAPGPVDHIELQVMIQERKADGNWGKPRPGAPSQEQAALLPAAVDREIVGALYGATNAYYGGYYGVERSYLRPALAELLVPLIGRSGRCVRKPAFQGAELQPLRWDGDTAWQFRVDVTREPNRPYAVTGVWFRGDELLVAGQVQRYGSTAFALCGDRIIRVDHGMAPMWTKFFGQRQTLSVPVQDIDRFLAAVFACPELPPLNLPPELAVGEVIATPRPVFCVRAHPDRWANSDDLQGEVKFRIGDDPQDHDPSAPHGTFDRESRTLRKLDPIAVQTARTRAEELRLPRDRSMPDCYRFRSKKLPAAVRALTAEGWQVEAEGKLYRAAGQFDLKVSSGIDWFELHGTVDFEGVSVPLPTILQAIRRQQTTIELGADGFGMLPEAWLKKYSLLASVGDGQEDHVRFKPHQVGLLDALLAAQPEVDVDAVFRKAREQFRTFSGLKAAKAPKSFVGELRPYQCDGLGWLQFLRKFGFGGCLADDMGLGKTVQVLAMLAERSGTRPSGEPATSLIVVPKSIVWNWRQEAGRFAPKLKVLDHTGKERVKDVKTLMEHDVVLTTYGTLRNDAALFKDIEFDYCILDESQAVKNADTESAKAVRLLKGRHRLAMSGTPIENHLGELWSLFEFLNPGLLGGTAALKALGVAGRNPDPDSREVLAKALRPFILRRTKDQVAPDLPQKTEKTVYVDLDDKQRKAYDELKEFYRQSLLSKIDAVGLAKSKIQVLEALLRLRQAACHPALLDKRKINDPSAKLDALMPQLSEVFEEGHKALVFSQFTSFLALVRKKLDAAKIPYEYLDGQTRDRQARVDRFQNDQGCKLFLISLKAGGVGLNLTAADYVFLLDPWWSPAVEAQAIDRAHRIGQTKSVFAYRIIARNTVEEKVLALQETKRDLADAIINADNSLIRGLKREDLELLLS